MECADYTHLCDDVSRWDGDDRAAMLAQAAAERRAVATGSSSSISSSSGSYAQAAIGTPIKVKVEAKTSINGLSDESKAMRRGVRELVTRSQRVYGVLYECIPDELRQQSAHVTAGYAYGLWHWLETKLQPTEQDNVNALFAEFFSLAQSDDETFDAYRARVNQVDARLTAAKNRPSRAQYSFVLMDRLQPRFHAAVLAMKVNGTLRDADAINWELVATLINQHGRNEDQLAMSSMSAGKAMAAVQTRGGARGGKFGSRGGRGGGSGSGGSEHKDVSRHPRTLADVECFNCHEMGHMSRNCDKPRQSNVGGAPGGAREGQRGAGGEYAAAARRQRAVYDDNSDDEGVRNYGCMIRIVDEDDDSMTERAMAAGSQAKALRRLVRPGEGSSASAPSAKLKAAVAPTQSATAPAAAASESAAPKKPAAPGVAGGKAVGRRPTQSIDKVLTSTGWGIDTMASLHVSGNKDVFDALPRRCAPVKIEVADGAFVVAMQRGSVRLRVRNAADSKTIGVTIDNVYYHERFKVNLLSWGILKELDWELVSTKASSTVTTPGNNRIALRTGERVMVMEGCAPERVYSAIGGDTSGATEAHALELQRMHERLGHVGFDRMVRIIKAGKSRGLDKLVLSDKVIAAARELVLACKACREGKGTRTAFSHDGLDKGAAPFEVLHMDTFEARKDDGTPVYGLVMVDAFSETRWVTRATSKDLVATQVLSILECVQTQTAVKVKRLRSDGGSEFINKTLKTWCSHNGTEVHPSPPRTQQLNGVAERAVRSVKDGGRTMLMHCGLPGDAWWFRAMEHFVFVWNRTAVATATGVTPYEAMYKRMPSVKNLHVFGCDMYVFVPKEKRATFDPKVDAGIYLGHDDEMNCPMVKLLRTGKIVRSRDVSACDTNFTHAHAIAAGDDAVLNAVEQANPSDQDSLAQDIGKTTEETSEPDDGAMAPEKEYKISRIVGRESTMVGRGANRRETRVRYKVRWDGYDESGDTWEPAEQLIADGVKDIIDEYENDKRTASTKPSAGVTEMAHMAMSALLREKPNAGDPQTYSQAVSGLYGLVQEWQRGMDKEWDGCIERGVWQEISVADLPPSANVLPVKWVYKTKTDEHGMTTAHKARLTPKGFRQLYGIDYNEVFAPTGKYKAMRVALSLAVAWDYEIEQLDVTQAFLNAELKEEVYMEMPEGYRKTGVVLRLLKALYGLKQAPREWHKLIDGFLRTDLGFVPTVSDPCLYMLKSQGGRLILLFLFVDDMQVYYSVTDKAEWEALKAALLHRFDTKDMGESTWMLAMGLKRNRAERTATLDQALYVTKALERFGLAQCKTVPTPERVGHEEEAGADTPAEDPQRYMELVGTLLYAAICTRPDISHAVMVLTRHMQAPLRRHEHAAERVLRYLAGTKTIGLVFGAARGDRGKKEGGHTGAPASDTASTGVVLAYADADWANDRSDRRSVTGWVVRLNGDVVAWTAKKQGTVAQSTCEAELYAEGAAINEVLWQRGLLAELGVTVATSSVIYGDNQSTVALSANGIKSERTKHIDIKWNFITEKVSEGVIQLVWIPTTEQQADIFTKALAKPQFEVLRTLLLGQ